jgi:hypothetical protein
MTAAAIVGTRSSAKASNSALDKPVIARNAAGTLRNRASLTIIRSPPPA